MTAEEVEESDETSRRDGVVAQEVKRQAVILAFTVLTAAAIMVIQADPTQIDRAKMWAARGFKQLCIKAANYSLALSDWAEQVYEQHRA